MGLLTADFKQYVILTHLTLVSYCYSYMVKVMRIHYI